jgi:hypothetical protein
MDTLYRFHEVRWSESRLVLVKDEFKVLSKTEHGVWIDVYGNKRFVNLDARKRYACPTVQEALESFQARKKRQIRILTRQLKQAEAALTLTPENDSTYYGLGL